ncbi:M48 family metalloprotease [Azospirillum sp. SYSU D00513]|uniref:M48 family metalloprotease n=1 Tax=Azospirillum sp. SYSU D00513 TaxID=2812561 RepID=UPI001A95C10D|nr:M48 family metalloprotease [Azospirillum sp. SYSU D00513]
MPLRIRGTKRARLTFVALLLLTLLLAAPFAAVTVQSLLLVVQGGDKQLDGVFGLVLVGLPFAGWTFRFFGRWLFAADSIAKAAKAKIITPSIIEAGTLISPAEANLYGLVHTLAKKAGLPAAPKLAIVPNAEMNAFAVGRPSNYLIGVNVGAVNALSQDELAAVLGHEVAHVVMGDSSTKALAYAIQDSLATFFLRPLLKLHGVIRALPIVLGAMVLTFLIALGSDETKIAAILGAILLLPQIALTVMLLCQALIALHSRWREFHADAAGASLVSTEAMISALTRIANDPTGRLAIKNPLHVPAAAAFGIKDAYVLGGISRRLFASHPATEARIKALSKAL